MEKEAESDAKNRIEKNEVLYYEVRVSYHTGNEIVKNFPATIDVKLGSIKKGEKSFVRDKELRHWQKDLQKPPWDEATALVIDLSTEGRKTLQYKLGLLDRLARNIADENKLGRFKDEKDFRTRMQAQYNDKDKFEKEY